MFDRTKEIVKIKYKISCYLQTVENSQIIALLLKLVIFYNLLWFSIMTNDW